MAGNRVGDQLLLEGVAVYELTESGWKSLQVHSLQAVLDAVKPDHAAKVEKILRKMSPNREITLSREMLLKPEFATSGSSIVLRKEGDGFVDTARIGDDVMHRISQALGLSREDDSGPDSSEPDDEMIWADTDDAADDAATNQKNAKKKRRKR